MQKTILLLSILAAITLFFSCASYNTQYAPSQENWQDQELPIKPIQQEVFLIGDGGGNGKGKPVETLRLIGNDLKKVGKNSTVLFLGDNIYPHGLPAEGKPDRLIAEKNIINQLDIVKDHPGKVYFIPGNHDWEAVDGVAGVKRQETFVQSYLDRGDTFIPDNGCSGPEVKKLSKNTTLIAIDSQWYLENWDHEKGINEDCEFRTRDQFLLEVMDKIKDNRSKNIILAMHHPLNSNGRHGGHFTAKEHLFPLTVWKKNLLIPLPGIGSLAAFLRSNIASPQELTHPNYQALKESLIEIADKYTNVIFVSGHEHSLQYFEEENQFFIVSGSSSRRTPVGLGDDAQFVAGVEGYARLHIYEDGEVWVSYWATMNKDGKHLKKSSLLFRKKIRDPLPSEEDLIPTIFPEYEQLKRQDSTITSVMTSEELPIFNQTFWGHLYSQDYLTPFKMPVLDLDTAKGGLIAYEKGGGNQSNSVRLKNKEGKIFQLRTVKKVTERFPSIVRKTFANELVKQQLTAGNPFSALTVGPMASAINVFHSNPKIVYLPKQPNLGIFNEFGGEVYLFEERGKGDWSDLASFGNSQKIENMGNVIEAKLKNHKTLIDQKQVLRSRLFDNIIGDWDRHTDQWRWASYKLECGKTLYKPIPRDRDQAYSNFDGIANALASYTVPFTRAAHKYDGDVDTKEETWLNHQARHFDRLFLNELTLKEWIDEAKFIQENLTDEVIEKGIKRLPPFAYEKRGRQLVKWTKERRNNILTTAKNYYKILNEKVEIPATHKNNLILIDRLSDRETKVTIYELIQKKNAKEILYERVFENNITKEIHIYGLDGDDIFHLTGEVNNSPLIRLIGGNGVDEFMDQSNVAGLKRKTKIYDDELEEVKLDLSKETKNNIGHREEENNFDILGFNYNFAIPIPSFGINPDDGFFIGLGVTNNTYSFKQHQIHKWQGNLAFGTGAISFNYEGDYFDAFDHWDAYLRVALEVPRYVSNFHGIGNETKRNIDQNSREYYRVRRTLMGVYPAFKLRGENGTTISVGPSIESISIENDEDRLVVDTNPIIRSAAFDQQYFTGGHFQFNFSNADYIAIPTRGLNFSLGTIWRGNLNDFDRQTVRLNSSLSIYNRLGVTDRLVLANRVGLSHIIGDFDFFQAVNIGGEGQLRGFANQRFSGQTAFYHNVDLRLKIFNSENNKIPISGGITFGFDHGRVWIEEDLSNKWHTSYGATLWAAPLDYMALSIGYFQSEEDNRFTVQAGFQF